MYDGSSEEDSSVEVSVSVSVVDGSSEEVGTTEEDGTSEEGCRNRFNVIQNGGVPDFMYMKPGPIIAL